MAATMNQFVAEVTKIFERLYKANLGSRSRFKEAFERVCVKKMPGATENERRKLVSWALSLYDYERRQGGMDGASN